MNVEIPEFVSYPGFINVSEERKLFDNLFVYIIEEYDFDNGYNLYIGFRDGNVLIRIADFQSNVIDIKEPNDDKVREILKISNFLTQVMHTIKINDASFYFSDTDLLLVDVMISINKFLGPGMINDLFGKSLPIQKVIGKEIFNDKCYDEYKSKLVKPSRYRHIVLDNRPRPLYGVVT